MKVVGLRVLVGIALLCSGCHEITETASSGSASVSGRDGYIFEVSWSVPGSGQWPTILIFGHPWWVSQQYVQAGYATVKAEVRSLLFHSDGHDSQSLIQWIVEQPWSDGRVAMAGISRGAASQWGAMRTRHPALKAIYPVGISPEPWRRMYRDNGALQLAHTMNGRAVDGRSTTEHWAHLPLLTADTRFRGQVNDAWRAYLRHSTYDEFWRAIDFKGQYWQVDIPVYQTTGWYDNYAAGILEAWSAIRSANPALINRVRVHSEGHRGDGQEIRESIRFFDWVLRSTDDGISTEPPIKVYVQNANEWRFFYEWPPAGSRAVRLFTDAEGSLKSEGSSQSGRSSFRYDPSDPPPTLFTNTSKTDAHPGWIQAGQGDITEVWRREDVLAYSSPRLSLSVDVIGPVNVVLHASTDGFDTDWIGRLVEVTEAGEVLNIVDGIVRARYREDLWGDPKLLVPGRMYRYDILLQATAYQFREGSRIGLILCSASFPMWDRNLNRGDEMGLGTLPRTAEQTVFHGGTNPTWLEIPTSNDLAFVKGSTEQVLSKPRD